jgi:quinol monooxygenase YgiN
MITLIVKALIKPEHLHDFIDECRISQRNTLDERLCRAYTIQMDAEDENTVILVEIYHSEEAIEIHKKTEHFINWRNNVFDYVVQRTTTKYISI